MFGFLRRRRTADLGSRGEALAARLLRRQGHRILARNYRCTAGEADLITLDRSTKATDGAETICIVEVKTRRSDQYTDPASAVDTDKRRRLRKVARHYLDARDADGYNLRFDIVSIVIADDVRPQIEHIRGAFT